ncbi:MAG: S-layer homology domain-containing protein [Clostridia bacterium]|nr:S-layer homology domain-containing protein [Clostridia bacterium]
MRKANKTVILALIVGCISFALPTPSPRAEVSGSTYEESAECLAALGLAEYDPSEDLSAYVTREHFCEIISKYFNIAPSGSGEGATTPFADVEISRSTFGIIRAMYDRGYVSGGDERKFHPEDNISTMQAASIAVRMLGYAQEASANGGYPGGYIATAYAKDILNEAFSDINAPITLGSVYKMLYDMLDVPMVLVNFSGASTEYTAKDGKTVLSEYCDAEKLDGIVTANMYTGISDPDAAVTRGHLKIGDRIYSALSDDMSAMIGMRVSCYVTYKDDDNGVIVYIKEKDNGVTTISSDDIKELSADRISWYTDDGKASSKHKIIDGSADVIYNGKALLDYGTIENLEIANGSVALIDNDHDGRIDVLSITEYKNYFINAVDKTSKTIYDYDANRSLETNSTGDIVEIFASDGSRTKFSSLKKNTLISVAKSSGGSENLIRIYINDGTVEDKVLSISDDEVNVGGSVYKLSPDFAKKLSASDYGKFYLDICGKIGAFGSETATDGTYALVYKSWYDPDNESANFKLYTEGEKFISYALADRVTINGRSEKTGESDFIGQFPSGTLLKYSLNEAGDKITKLEIPLPMDVDDEGNKQTANSNKFRMLYEGSSFKFRNGMFDGKVVITENTLIFSMPKEDNWDNKDMFGTLTANSFSGGTSYSKHFRAFVTGECPVNVADVMVVDDMTKGSIGNGTKMVFVTDVMEGLNNQDELCKIIEGNSGGSRVEYYCMDESIISGSGVMRGDLIRVGVDSSGNVNKVQKVYNHDGSNLYGALLVPDEGVSENTASFDSEFRVAVGNVSDISGGYMRLKLVKKSGDSFYEDTAICKTEGASVVLYDSGNSYSRELQTCSVNDIIRGDRVVIRMQLAVAKEIVIIR